MDSITQVILGAACGEAVLGKKIGNRAMIWGGIAGTLPDLDVLANVVADPLTALIFHRGPMHSLVFAIIMPFILGQLVYKLYERDWPHKKNYKVAGYAIGIILFSLVSILICLLANLVKGSFSWLSLSFFIVLGFYFFYNRYQQIFSKAIEFEKPTKWEWIQLFFWAICTHPILDMFTTFGTRLFWPFSDVRVALSTISIADPYYTIPFAFFLLMAALRGRLDPWRRYLFRTAMVLSSAYFIFTFINKYHVNQLFEQSLHSKGIQYEKYMTVPTILNNFLWFNIAKEGTRYHYTYYSIFDQGDTLDPLEIVEGNHEIFKPYRGQEIQKTLPWFSNEFYKLVAHDSGKISYYDLRYGATGNNLKSDDDIIFKFNLKDVEGQLKMEKSQPQPENDPAHIEKFKRRMFGDKN